MALVTLGEDVTFISIPASTVALLSLNEATSYTSIPTDTNAFITVTEDVSFTNTLAGEGGGAQEHIINKVWDTAVGGGSWVLWETDAVDDSGSEYPYPANWGVSTSLYRVQSVRYETI